MSKVTPKAMESRVNACIFSLATFRLFLLRRLCIFLVEDEALLVVIADLCAWEMRLASGNATIDISGEDGVDSRGLEYCDDDGKVSGRIWLAFDIDIDVSMSDWVEERERTSS